MVPLVPMVMPMIPFALPLELLVPLVSQWYHWLPMVPLGEPRMEQLTSLVLELFVLQNSYAFSFNILVIFHGLSR